MPKFSQLMNRNLGSREERAMTQIFLSALKSMERRIMASLDETLELVRAANTRTDSLIELTKGLKGQLDAVLAGALTPAQQSKVDEIFKEVTDQAAEVDAAVTENTPPTT
jgi:hypothetical protein